MWRSQPWLRAAVALLLVAVALAAPYADKDAPSQQLDSREVAELARQLTNELAEAVAEAASDTSGRASARAEGEETTGTASVDGGVGTTSTSETQVIGDRFSNMVQVPNVDADPVRLTVNLLVGDQTRDTDKAFVIDKMQGAQTTVVGENMHIEDKEQPGGIVPAIDIALVTDKPPVNGDVDLYSISLAKKDDPTRDKSGTTATGVIDKEVLAIDKTTVIRNYLKNTVSGKAFSNDKAPMSNNLERDRTQVRDVRNNGRTLESNCVLTSAIFAPTSETLMSGRSLVNGKEWAADKSLLNEKERETDSTLMCVKGKMGDNEMLVNVEAHVRDKDVTSDKTPLANQALNDDRAISKEKVSSNGITSNEGLNNNKKAVEGIKNLVNDMTEAHNPTTYVPMESSLHHKSSVEGASPSSNSSSSTISTMSTSYRSSTTTLTSTSITSSVKHTTSPALDEAPTSTPTSIWIFTAHEISSSCRTTRSTADHSKSTDTSTSTISTKHTPKDQQSPASSSRNNALQLNANASGRVDATLAFKEYEDKAVNVEDESTIGQNARRRVRRNNGGYDPEEIGRQLALVLGRAAHPKRATEKERNDFSDTESLNKKGDMSSRTGSRRSRQEYVAMEDEVPPTAGTMAPVKDAMVSVGDAMVSRKISENAMSITEYVPMHSEDAGVSSDDAMDSTEEGMAASEDIANPAEDAYRLAAGVSLHSPSSPAPHALDVREDASSNGQEAFRAQTVLPLGVRADVGLRASQRSAIVNEGDSESHNAVEFNAKKIDRKSAKSPKVEAPWLVDTDGDHIMLISNDPSTTAKSSSSQSRSPWNDPPEKGKTAGDALVKTPGWLHDSRRQEGTGPRPALLSNLKKLEQELNRERADMVSTDPEGLKAMSLKAPITVFDLMHSKGVILMVERKNNSTTKPTTEAEKVDGVFQKDAELPTSDFQIKESTGVPQGKDTENENEDKSKKTMKTQEGSKKMGQQKYKFKPLTELSKVQAPVPKQREQEKPKMPATPGVIKRKSTGKSNSTFVQRTVIETAVGPGPDGCLTANTAILVHQAFVQPPSPPVAKTRAPEAKISSPLRNRTKITTTNTSTTSSNTTSPPATKSSPICIVRGRMPEMLPVGDGKSHKTVNVVTIDLGAPGTLRGRPQVTNTGSSGVQPPKRTGSKSDASSENDEDDVVRSRPMGIAARAKVGGGSKGVDAGTRKDPLIVADTNAIDLRVPDALRGRPELNRLSETGDLRVFHKIREKEKEDVVDNEDASSAANILVGVTEESEQKLPVRGVVRSKGDRSHARVQIATPETGVLYGGDSGPEVVVTEGPPAGPREGVAVEDPADGGARGDQLRPAATTKLPDEEATGEQGGSGDDSGSRLSQADRAKGSSLAEALGIQESSTDTAESGWSEDAGAGMRRRHKRPHALPSLLILPDDRLEMDVGDSERRPPGEVEDAPR